MKIVDRKGKAFTIEEEINSFFVQYVVPFCPVSMNKELLNSGKNWPPWNESALN